jgi:hypothetical protein
MEPYQFANYRAGLTWGGEGGRGKTLRIVLYTHAPIQPTPNKTVLLENIPRT